MSAARSRRSLDAAASSGRRPSAPSRRPTAPSRRSRAATIWPGRIEQDIARAEEAAAAVERNIERAEETAGAMERNAERVETSAGHVQSAPSSAAPRWRPRSKRSLRGREPRGRSGAARRSRDGGCDRGRASREQRERGRRQRRPPRIARRGAGRGRRGGSSPARRGGRRRRAEASAHAMPPPAPSRLPTWRARPRRGRSLEAWTRGARVISRYEAHADGRRPTRPRCPTSQRVGSEGNGQRGGPAPSRRCSRRTRRRRPDRPLFASREDGAPSARNARASTT